MRSIYLSIAVFLIFSGLAQAEEPAAPAVSATKMNEDDLRQSFQREYVYLTSQKEALKKQKSKVAGQFQQKIQEAKSQTQKLQRQLVNLSAENDEQHEYLSELERRKKDLQKKSSSLENTFKKSHELTAVLRSELRFESPDKKTTENVMPDSLRFEDFDGVMTSSMELLHSASRVETYDGSFLDLEGQLVDGSITRIGRSAAIGSTANQHYILGPDGEGLLKALEPSSGPNQSSLALYIFESLNKAAKLQKNSGFTEKLADLSPLLFLAMILLLVAGLFTVLIKV